MNNTVILRKGVFIAYSIVLLYAFSSCIPQKRIKLVQDKEKDTTMAYYLKPRPKNTIQPFDNLFIRVISPDEQTSEMFNNTDNSQRVTNYNMISYTVNDSGYIDFPFAGLIKLKDLTILEAKDTIQYSLSRYIRNANVVVKFVGKSVTVLGEVKEQGKFVIYDDNINIFSAISLAEGLTDYGDRKNVTIIREKAGVAKYHYVDLTDKNILTSEFYYLKPEDILIVPPLKQKSYGFASFPYGLFLSSVTTIIAVISLMR